LFRLYKTGEGWAAQSVASGKVALLPAAANAGITAREDLFSYLEGVVSQAADGQTLPLKLLAPIETQEVWAAGVTYYRSRDARMAESKDAGGGDFYSRVYVADRPELFFKATPSRVVGPGGAVRIRSDSKWNIPEPELTLLISPKGVIQGYTIGNDMSSRDIEGLNPLYLPQAKVYDRCCGLGPGILVTKEPLSPESNIELEILRGGVRAFFGATKLKELKRKPVELVEYLFRDNIFANGCFLLTGTGIIPPDEFSLLEGDEIDIHIEGIGNLRNIVG
jgi:2-dehydro-3-deoxy-D-arabinonate dehydratase